MDHNQNNMPKIQKYDSDIPIMHYYLVVGKIKCQASDDLFGSDTFFMSSHQIFIYSNTNCGTGMHGSSSKNVRHIQNRWAVYQLKLYIMGQYGINPRSLYCLQLYSPGEPHGNTANLAKSNKHGILLHFEVIVHSPLDL